MKVDDLYAWTDGLSEPSPAGARRVAYFISSHGFGHAARACAIMAAVHTQDPSVHFEIFAQVPEWFFADSLQGGYHYHAAPTDVGLVQTTAWQEDLDATMQRLDELLPFDPFLLRSWADWLLRLQCRLVVCDIAPLGLAVAGAAGLPSVLVENFTWDWIYAGYLDLEPRFGPHIGSLSRVFARADYHLQAIPVCVPAAGASELLPPVSRAPHTPAEVTRAKLGVPEGARLALVTMGGYPAEAPPPNIVLGEGVYLVMAGAGGRLERCGQVILLPQRSGLYHPDLVQASDAVIGKAGYSTVAEAFHAGVPFGYVPRPRFRESAILERFVETEMQGVRFAFDAGAPADLPGPLEALLARPRVRRDGPNGAELAARFLLERLD